MFTKAFWVATVERIVRGAAATFLAVYGADRADALHVNWGDIGVVTGSSALVTLALCLAGSFAGDNNGPSFVNEKVVEVPPGK
jgi:hypothetical protein